MSKVKKMWGGGLALSTQTKNVFSGAYELQYSVKQKFKYRLLSRFGTFKKMYYVLSIEVFEVSRLLF